MDVRDLRQAIRAWWLVIVLAAVIAGSAAGVFTARQPLMYSATAQGIVSISDPQNRPPYSLSAGAQYILDRMTSYAWLGVTTPVLTPVVENLRLKETPLSLSGRVTSHSIVGKAVLEVTVTYNDPKVAAAIADGVVAGISRSISALENGNVQLVPTGAAVVPSKPSNHKVMVNSAMASAGGVILGSLIAVALHVLGARRRPVRDVSSIGSVNRASDE